MSDDNISERSQNYTSSLIGKRTGLKLIMTGYVRDSHETVMLFDRLIADIQNAENCSRTEAITKAMILGLTLYSEHNQIELSQETLDAIEAFNFEIQAVIEETKAKHVKRKYEQGRTSEAQELCERYNLDFEDIIMSYTLPVHNQDKSPVIRDWLKRYFDVNESATVSRIKADMLDDGIIDLEDWGLVKNIASYEGYSGQGKRGTWEKVN